ncbi:uncharacterized protein LOC127286359 [Leptopilina boulardi]|uniref:uncharacterized protein LOC127286359 n=1 Tax=Leptopilina boulardi TaxID=63433 RepID=UPI0021F69A84|nr:uncharacterized protein LOC127286359 [Leptopilina boulardi]
MPVKSVYCKISTGDQTRCKKVKFEKHEDDSDCQKITEALLNSAKKDVALDATLRNKFLVLQQENQKLNQYCDLDSQESVANESILNVLLISKQKADDKSDETSTCDYKVVATYENPVFDENIVHKSVSNLIIEFEEELYECDPSISKPKRRSFQTPRVNYPADLPPLPQKLQQIKDKNKVYECQLQFIFLRSTHLESLTDGWPTKTEYFNYCKTIVDFFPELKGGTKNNFDVLKNQISTAIRNRRYHQNQKLKKTGEKRKSSELCSAPAKKMKVSDQVDNAEAMTALKNCSSSDNSNHVQRLLRETYDQRRMWIVDEAKNVRDIIQKWPQLQSYAAVSILTSPVFFIYPLK